MKKHIYIAFALCGIIIIAFACKTLIEPDIWWQITTGEWILKHHQVPKTDILSYTYAGEPWVNIKWLSEVFMYSVAKFSSPEMIYLVLGALFIPIIYFIYQNNKKLFTTDKSVFSYSIFYALLFFIVIVSHRINGRPEAFSYFFTALYLYIFIKSIDKNYLLFLLVPLQIVWCNTHEAYGVGIVLIIIYSVFQFIWSDTKTKIYIGSTLFLSIAGLALNPIGTKIYAYTLNIFTQLDKNKFTSELLDFTASGYWDFFSVLNLFTFIIVVIYLFQIAKKANWNLKLINSSLPLFYIIITIAFFYLSLKSNRNIPFFQIVAFPIYAKVFSNIKATWLHESKMAFYIFVGIIYISIVSNTFYKTFDTHNEFGLGVSPVYNPIGAVNYLKSKEVKGKVFSDFLISNYALYHLRPQYKSYIDLRDLDVFPAKFFENCLVLYQAPESMVSPTQTIWQMADSLDQFSYVLLLNSPDFAPLHQTLHSSTNYQIVYADANSSVYKKLVANESKNNQVDFYKSYTYYPSNTFSNLLNKILNPLYSNPKDRVYDFEEYKSTYDREYM